MQEFKVGDKITAPGGFQGTIIELSGEYAKCVSVHSTDGWPVYTMTTSKLSKLTLAEQPNE